MPIYKNSCWRELPEWSVFPYATNVCLHVHRTARSANWSATKTQAVESAVISLFLPDDFDKADSALKIEPCLFQMSDFSSQFEHLRCRPRAKGEPASWKRPCENHWRYTVACSGQFQRQRMYGNCYYVSQVRLMRTETNRLRGIMLQLKRTGPWRQTAILSITELGNMYCVTYNELVVPRII